jgi:regulation of enolase protein 1 (concanavalin A-like superfamily)
MRKVVLLLIAVFLAGQCHAALAQTMSVDSFSGGPTANEISSFVSYVNSIQPATWSTTTNMGNEYAQGHSGEAIKAMGVMYEVSGNTAILDRMIYFDDTLLSQRNDILAAPQGQRTAWTGTIAPVWPGSTTDPAPAGAEQGDPVGHLAYAARLILQTPAIWNTNVSIGDPFGFGTTYLARAKTYLAQADVTIQQFFLPSLLNLTNSNHYFFSTASPYMSGSNLPWNQQMMISYGLENAAMAHQILGDAPATVAQYDAIVQANLQWFWSLVVSYTDGAGNTAYNWGYSPSQSTGEDSNHASLDCAGFYRAYMMGRYGITAAQMTPFANTLVDVMSIGPQHYSGRVDGTDGTGHGAPTTYIRSGMLFLADSVPNSYTAIMGADLTEGGTTGSPDTFSRFEWVKNKRYQSFTLSASPASQTVGQGGATTFAATVTGQGNFNGAVSLTASGLPAGATASFSPATITGGGTSTLTVQTSGSTPVGTYPLTITATALGTVGQNAGVSLTVAAAAVVAAPTFSPAGGTYSSAQTVTISTATSGATIRYTTDGSTPSETAGAVYSGPVTVSSTQTLKAIAYESGMTDSSVSSATYTISTTSLPSGWSDLDIGAPGLAGSATYSGGVFTVNGSGADIYGTADQFNYVSQTANGNLTITARVASQTNTNAWAKAGVMIRETTAAGAAYVGVYITPGKGASLQYRTATNASATNGPETTGLVAPYWVQLVRSGSTFTANISADGVTWTTLGTATVTMATSATAGLAVCSHDNTKVNTSTFDNVSVAAPPAGWTDLDIGAPGLAGSGTVSGSTYTVQGGGADIYGAADQFNYMYKTTSSTSVTITARVATQQNTNAWAKSGVMIRETTAAGSTYVGVYITPGKGASMQYRTATNAGASNGPETLGLVAPYCVRLSRSGSTFTGSISPDGVTWTTLGSVSITMATSASEGLAVTAHDNTQLNTSTFDNVTP